AGVDEERLIRLPLGVAGDHDRDGRCPLTGGEVQRPGGRPVVVVGRRGRAVGRGEVDVYPLVTRRRQGDGEDQRLRAAVALPDRGVGDGDRRRRVVVEDGPRAGRVVDGRVRRAGEVDGEILVVLVGPVAVHRDRDGLHGVAGVEGQRPGRGDVVLAGDGAAVGRAVVDRDRLAAAGQQADGEDGVDRTHVA